MSEGQDRDKQSKPRFVILPRGISAEEAARLLKAWAQQHQADGPPAEGDAGPDA
jgi:hypothetical protein